MKIPPEQAQRSYELDEAAAPVSNANSTPEHGWRRRREIPSLAESFRSIPIPEGKTTWRTALAFAGPGALVAVGYMDPGNWATDLAGGSQFGYMLLSVVLISNFMAMLLQYLAVKLGIVTGRDLAQACSDHYSRPVSLVLWVLCETAIMACDLAEVIGSAIALNMLFGLPLVAGVLVTAADVFAILLLQNHGFRWVEAIVATLLITVGGCFVFELVASHPDWFGVAAGLIPDRRIVTNPQALYLAIGILGATVMPHNLYLHSSIVQTRAYNKDKSGKARAIKFGTIDSTLSLFLAFFINAAILVLSASAFHGTQHEGVADINDAYKLLSPVLGTSLAGTLFAVALLCSGQNSTLTGTLAGQIVMEGFLHIRLKPWVRRLITRGIAIIPAAIVAGMYGEHGVAQLLVLSQVILSMQLAFAVVPLVQFTSDKAKMGPFVNGPGLKVLSWTVTALITGLNIYLLFVTLTGK
jgi:manganese transport protein